MVEECLELTSLEILKAHGRDTIAIRGSLTPYLRLRSHFRLAGEAPEIEQIVICKVEEHLFGLVVDQVIGKYQTVIKNLGSIYRKVTGISGATVLGDGTVALILDVDRLMRQAGQGPMVEIQEKGRQR
jgi:two-component system chemotaxis sensor kinase CheA